MTTPVIPETEPHVRALRQHLADNLTMMAVEVGRAPEADPPYVVAYSDSGDVQSARLCGRREHITIHVMIHAVGTGPEQASWAMDHARAVLLGSPPAVAGRKVYRLVQTMGPPPMQRDDNVSPPLYYQAAEYRLASDPA